MRFLKYLGLFFCLFITGCTEHNTTQNPIEKALKSNKPIIKKVVDSVENHELQIIFTKINRNGDSISFTDYQYQVNDSNYFYPASTVKLPIALLALEKLGKDKRFNRKTQFYVEGDSIETTVENEIDKIFAVSDNEAFNRLFEYLGADYINKTLKSKGLKPIRISHRLSTPDAYNVTTKPLIFYEKDSLLTEVPGTINQEPTPLKINRLIKGKGYMDNDSLVMEPMDFSLKNYLPLTTLHNIVKRVIFPQTFKENERFELKPTDRTFILNSMASYPKDHGYDPVEYYDSYGKFFIYGDSKENIPRDIKIHNKVGYAYGYLTDCAYIHDQENDVEFIVSATIHVNENRIFNDNNYEFDNIGIPFLAELGRQLYKQQLQEKP
ncbi:serine hydrolase [Galbibacter sp. EGI 63066]|uniref:serine hydrolase n=1 Tax=Galbibacter sp. EGI 63066 TaxID=2993559 RepID=UPI002248BEC6|nr:serine hydrolase [Galbibacter sp. EGI 63066]MCX2679233.1 serine hydrolase [Galbibacter sp. EGI 63066]